jgi:hypothetical protein
MSRKLINAKEPQEDVETCSTGRAGAHSYRAVRLWIETNFLKLFSPKSSGIRRRFAMARPLPLCGRAVFAVFEERRRFSGVAG